MLLLFFADIIWLTKALEVTILWNIELWNTKWSMSIKIIFREYIRMTLNMPERNPNRHWVHRYDTDTVMYCIYILYQISYFNIKFGLFCCQCQPNLCGVCLLFFSHQPLHCFTSSPRPCGANGGLHSSVVIEVSFDCLEPWGVLRCRHVAMVKTCSKHKHIKRKHMDTQRLEPQWMQSCYDLNHLWNDVCFFLFRDLRVQQYHQFAPPQTWHFYCQKEMSHARPGTLKVSCCRSTQRRGTQHPVDGMHSSQQRHCQLWIKINISTFKAEWLEVGIRSFFFRMSFFFSVLPGLYVFQCFSLECSWKSGQLAAETAARRTVYWCMDVLTWNWNWRPH